jgi:bifunctional non-homologous end joining protein LigD
VDKPNDWMVFLREDDRPPRDEIPNLDPMFATLSTDPFDSDKWIFEVKWDGVRALAVCADETVLLSRTKREITATYPEFERLHERIVALEAVVDGEIVALANGKPSFERLQARMNLQKPRDIERMIKQVPVVYIAFDLLYLDGRSLVETPIEDRKKLLGEIVVPAPNVLVSDYVENDGTALFEAARAQGLEGIVAKRQGSPYRPGRRTREWIKIKTVHDADVVVGGWSRGEGSRSATFGALLIGAYSDGELRFLGAVGTGFSERTLAETMPKLQEIEAEDCPFAGGIEAVRAGRFGKPIIDPHWAEPVLVARIEYRELTAGGRLRAPSFKGLRTDKLATDCRFEDLPGGLAESEIPSADG